MTDLNSPINQFESILRFSQVPIRIRIRISFGSHVGKYDRADDRPKLAMLAANVGYQYWTDDRSRLG